MDASAIKARLRAIVADHLALAEVDADVEEAASRLLDLLDPALDLAVLDLARQAALEVADQLPAHRVEVRLDGDAPRLVVEREDPAPPSPEELEARLTLRLPEALKRQVETAARELGESVNAFVVRELSVETADRSSGRRVQGTIRT